MRTALQKAGMIGTVIMFTLFAVFIGEAAAIQIENPLGRDATFQTIIKSVTQWAIAVAVPLTTLMVVIAGYLYLTGGAKPEQIKKANQALTWAAIGFVIILASASAATLIRRILEGR